MKMATSKKILHIASIYNYVTGGFLLLIGILGVAGVGAALDTSEALEDVGLSFGLLAKGSVILLLAGTAGIIAGICDREAAKDPKKVMPAWYFSIVMIVIQVVSMIFSISDTEEVLFNILSLFLCVVVFFAANSMKKEVGL